MSSPLFRLSAAFGFKRLFSQDCQLCGTRATECLCPDCERDLPYRRAGGCPSCAIEGPDNQLCGACLSDPPAFDRTVAAFRYDFPLDRLLQSYKFNQNLALTTFFTDALKRVVARGTTRPDTIIAIPLAHRRLAERGFNQSALLAAGLARKLGVEHFAHELLKVRDTPPQWGLDRAARLKNVRGAFDCTQALSGKHVAIVDDVMTTGATLSEAARVVKKAGATSVSAWVLARAGREWAALADQTGGESTDETALF
jgi:ComF family protein